MGSVWQLLKTKSEKTGAAFTVLAPMEDVTDTVFRQMVMFQGRPDLFMTEFTNCDGLASRGRARIIHRLEYTENQHPIVAQIWGRKVETYLQAIPLISAMGFDGVDINMGCPVPKVVKSGAGAGLIREPSIARAILDSVKEEIAKSENNSLSLSVKTRIGYDDIDLSWIEMLLKSPIDALTIHLRTKKEMSAVPVHWELMKNIIELRDSINPNIVIVGNGDITTKEQIATYKKIYGVDCLMIGRGIFEDIGLFNKDNGSNSATPLERIGLVRQHINLFLETWGTRKNFEMIKKYFKIYLKDFDGAAVLRNKLLRVKTPDEMLRIIEKYEENGQS